MERGNLIWRLACAFARAKTANVAMMFGLSLVPLAIAAGAGLDYAQAVMVRSQMLDALDAAALAVGGQPKITDDQAKTLAQSVFDANYKGPGHPTVTPAINGQSVSVTAADDVATTALALVGKTSISVSATSIVVWGQAKMWVSLVLDNTGSMSQTDSTGLSKMAALKDASHQLLAKLQTAAASGNPGDVQVAIIPFAKDVNVKTTNAGTSNLSASWIDWTDWEKAYGTVPSNLVGPGSACPWNSGCVSAPGSTSSTNTVPSSGSYAGYICPDAMGSSSPGQSGHYYNGCYNSTVNGTTTVTQTVSKGNNASCTGYSNCTCTGKGGNTVCTAPVTVNTYAHSWVANDHSLWGGCVMDRDQDADTNATSPNSKYPAENSGSCVSATVMTLNYTWDSTTDTSTNKDQNLSWKIDSMIANGGTNQTIGLQHGMQVQMEGSPYNAAALPANTARYIILLSDGLNTLDRWYGDGSNQSSSVDTRMALACTNAKNQGFIIYTLFVDIAGAQGNSTVLRNCASDTSKYYDLTTSSAIVTAFNDIAQKITNLRVSQ